MDSSENGDGDPSAWTPFRVLWAFGVFILAGLFEIGGGWLIWRAIREKQEPRILLAVTGAVSLAAYGFVPLLQPETPSTTFGRLYAVYGAIFIVMSVIWAAVLDGLRPDVGDYVGGALAFVGAGIMLFYPRAQVSDIPGSA